MALSSISIFHIQRPAMHEERFDPGAAPGQWFRYVDDTWEKMFTWSRLSLFLPFQSGQPVNLNCIHLKLNLNMERPSDQVPKTNPFLWNPYLINPFVFISLQLTALRLINSKQPAGSCFHPPEEESWHSGNRPCLKINGVSNEFGCWFLLILLCW